MFEKAIDCYPKWVLTYSFDLGWDLILWICGTNMVSEGRFRDSRTGMNGIVRFQPGEYEYDDADEYF